jgi:hypothetical protein
VAQSAESTDRSDDPVPAEPASDRARLRGPAQAAPLVRRRRLRRPLSAVRHASTALRASRPFRHGRGAVAGATVWANERLRLRLPVVVPDIKIHGLPRTGTNYLSALLEQNFKARVLGGDVGGWKHGRIAPAPFTVYVVLVKNPYTWLLSFRAWEEIHGRTAAATLHEFAASPVTHPRFAAEWHPRDPIDAWNTATRFWLEAATQPNVVVVRYEDLLADFAAQLSRVGETCGAVPRRATLTNLEERIDTWNTPRPRAPFNRARYLDDGIPEEYDDDALDLLGRRLDPQLVHALGYRLLER